MSDEERRSDPAESWEVQVRKGVLELVVLAALGGQRQYGLQLIRRLASDANLTVPEGTLYPLLNRLRKEGLVDAEWVEADTGHPRRYYRLNADGRRRAVRMARFWRDFTAGLDPILAPLLGDRRR
jgi:PadR family transcriptional regulator PadR